MAPLKSGNRYTDTREWQAVFMVAHSVKAGDYLSSLALEDLDQVVNLSNLGIGQVTRAWVMSRLVIGHGDHIYGEICCLKGLQGVQGYPIEEEFERAWLSTNTPAYARL
jgi:hypothetical protein